MANKSTPPAKKPRVTGTPGKIIATDMTKLKRVLKLNNPSQLHYAYKGEVVDDVKVEALLAESYRITNGKFGRRRMAVLIPDTLWVWLARAALESDSLSESLPHVVTDSELLAWRKPTYEWSKAMFYRFETEPMTRVYESSSVISFTELVSMASRDNYPSRHGQPLFILHRYVFNEQYSVTVEGDKLLIHIPEVIMDSVRTVISKSISPEV